MKGEPKFVFKYRPEIDGLRAFAVLPVIFFHAGFDLFKNGYLGVDVFFVISGFLITSILIKEMSEGKFSFRHFYERRARRILPALFAMILLCVPFAWCWMMPSQLINFSQSILSVLFFGSNIFFWSKAEYFAPASEEMPLLHTWSLGVEEQYYFLFPIVLMHFWRLGFKKSFCTLIAITAASLFSAYFMGRYYPEAAFYLSPFRVWQLLAGSLLALLSSSRPLHDRFSSRWGEIFASTGLALFFISIFYIEKSPELLIKNSLIATIGTFLLLAFAHPKTLIGRLLSTKILVRLGLLSYSAYLWHQPLFAFARIYFQQTHTSLTFVLLIVLTFILAFLSWKYVEGPFRKSGIFNSRQIFSFSLVSSAFFLALALIGLSKEGFPSRIGPNYKKDFYEIVKAVETSEFKFEEGCKFASKDISESFLRKFNECYKLHGPLVLVLGDSHGTDLYNALAISSTMPVIGITKGGCRPYSPSPICHYKKALKFFQNNKEKVRVVFFSQKGSYFLTENKKLPIREKLISKTQDYLAKVSAHVQVIWLGPQAEPNIDLRNINLMVPFKHLFGANFENQDIKELDRKLIQLNKNKSFKYISKLDLVGFNYDKDFYFEGNYTYSDKDHWSAHGEANFGKRLLKNELIAEYLVLR